jgi:hypothetical protein
MRGSPVAGHFVTFHTVPAMSRSVPAHIASYSSTERLLSPGVKRLKREADHLPPSSSEVKNEWSFISTRPYATHGVHREKLTSTVIQ